jgi:hypothetical protein
VNFFRLCKEVSELPPNIGYNGFPITRHCHFALSILLQNTVPVSLVVHKSAKRLNALLMSIRHCIRELEIEDLNALGLGMKRGGVHEEE